MIQYVLLFTGTVLTALITAGGTWLIAARRMSGSIRSTEAADLWKESTESRRFYAEENRELRKELARCHERIETMEKLLIKVFGDDLPDYLS